MNIAPRAHTPPQKQITPPENNIIREQARGAENGITGEQPYRKCSRPAQDSCIKKQKK